MSMYRMSSILGRKVMAVDGEVGTLQDFYFSDETWKVVHFVVQTGTYFRGRRLIMHPSLVISGTIPNDKHKLENIQVRATCDEVLASPDYMDDPSVSDQKSHDSRLHPHLLWFPTFDFSKVALRPMGATQESLDVNHAEVLQLGQNPCLQSFREVRGYAVLAEEPVDTIIGHVLDLLVMGDNHSIEQVLINTGPAHLGDLMIVRPTHIKRIEWSSLHVYLSRTLFELGIRAK